MQLLREEKLLEVELARTRQAIDKGKKNGKPGDKVIEQSEWVLKKVKEQIQEIEELQRQLREGNLSKEEKNKILLQIEQKKAAAKKQLQVIRLSSSGNSKAWDAVCNASSHIVAKAKDPVAVGLGLLAASVAISYAATPYLMLALGMSNPIGLSIAVACLACMAICAVWKIFSAAKNAPASNRKAAQQQLEEMANSMGQGAGNMACGDSLTPSNATPAAPTVKKGEGRPGEEGLQRRRVASQPLGGGGPTIG